MPEQKELKEAQIVIKPAPSPSPQPTPEQSACEFENERLKNELKRLEDRIGELYADQVCSCEYWTESFLFSALLTFASEMIRELSASEARRIVTAHFSPLIFLSV